MNALGVSAAADKALACTAVTSHQETAAPKVLASEITTGSGATVVYRVRLSVPS